MPRNTRTIPFTIVPLLVLILSMAELGDTASPDSADAPSSGQQPNIIFVLTDDLDTHSIAYMPHLRALLAEQGTTFSDFFVTDSLCCPSRSSILRGQYVHNHQVLGNSAPLGGFMQFHALGNEDSTIASWLRAAGYRTTLLGKYLNDYPQTAARTYVPPGWDHWVSPVDNTGYNGFLYVMNENTTLVPYGDQTDDYFTDVLSFKANVFIRDALRHGQPFFLYVATYAPHTPATPAPRSVGLFPGLVAPRTPSFNEADVEDKPQFIRNLPLLDPDQIKHIDELYRRRLESLQAVDEMLASLIVTLTRIGQLDNTYIFFTSDNGFHLGQHRMQEGKQTAYEEDIRVPLIVRGPGVPAGRTVDHLAVEIDLAPTFAALAGGAAPDFVDGRSLVPLLRGKLPAGEQWRQCLLLEHYAGSSEPFQSQFELAQQAQLAIPTYKGLRCRDSTYVEYETGERELYDLRRDPHQLLNIQSQMPPALLRQQAALLGELATCAGASCRAAEDGPAIPLYDRE
jgi:arylsulfatase A-like enzyme